MRVLGACSLGGAGHLGPLTSVLDAARGLGHDTLVVAPENMAELVARTGHALAPAGQPPESVIAPIREQLPVAPPAAASVLGNRELFGRLATEAMLPAVEEACDAFGPDLVLRDPTEHASAVVALRRGLRVATVAISLAQLEWSSIDVAAPALDLHEPGLAAAERATPYLSRFPGSLDPSPFPDTRRYRAEASPRPSAESSSATPWPEGDGPRVSVTFGTVLGRMTVAADVFRVALDAVRDRPWRVLLTVGPAFDPAVLDPLPANVVARRWVDQAEVLVSADAVVCHGGSGTVYGTLAAGVPLVVVPVFADQFENAARVERRGAGVTVAVAPSTGGGRTPIAATDAPRIAAAVESVLTDPSYCLAASDVAAEMASTPDPARVVAALVQ